MNYNSIYTGKEVEDAIERAMTSLQRRDIEHLATKEEIQSVLATQILTLNMSVLGELVVTYGADNSAFTDGYITEDGELVLEFNYD